MSFPGHLLPPFEWSNGDNRWANPHPLVRLAQEIDWGFRERRFALVCEPGLGQQPLPARLFAGLFILKRTHLRSDAYKSWLIPAGWADAARMLTSRCRRQRVSAPRQP
jgi:hypothetical protein